MSDLKIGSMGHDISTSEEQFLEMKMKSKSNLASF